MHIRASEAGHFQAFWLVRNATTTEAQDEENTVFTLWAWTTAEEDLCFHRRNKHY